MSRDLSDALIHFAYNVAMPALLVVTIAQEPARSLLAWRFLIAFGGGSLAVLCSRVRRRARLRRIRTGLASAMQGWAASMTNTGFVALPILQATYGPRAVLAGGDRNGVCRRRHVSSPPSSSAGARSERRHGARTSAPAALARHVILNPMVLSTLVGVAWSALGVPMPAPVGAYLRILADALTACALFAIGLGLSIDWAAGQFRTVGRADSWSSS